MVSFQCEACGDVLTKKKLDVHLNRCWNATFTCLDCMTTFQGSSYRSHTSCISEAQKYQGSTYKDKKMAKPQQANGRKQSLANSEPDQGLQVARLDVPPPAPSPPSAFAPPSASPKKVNVFDFLVADGDAPTSPSSSDSSFVSAHEDSQSSAAPSPTARRPRKYIEGRDFSYGTGPVERTLQKFDSAYALNAQINGDAARRSGQNDKTPAPARDPRPTNGADHSSAARSEKKRKRVDDLDLTNAKKDKSAVLHSGLTGGLSRLLAEPLAHEEASPLSPKKRTKKSKEEKLARKQASENGQHAAAEKERRLKKKAQPELKLLQNGKEVKAIEAAPPRQTPDQSHSEFFLSLVDKGYRSSKGQSIWGTLKMFNEGVYQDGAPGLYETAHVDEENQKRLFRGLRMKLNKQGEIVLFARPDKEEEP